MTDNEFHDWPMVQWRVAAFANLVDVVIYTLDVCDFPTLVALSHTTFALRVAVKRILQSRLMGVLNPFMHPPFVKYFMNSLRTTGGAMYGSTVNALMAPRRQWRPRNLNLSVPSGSFTEDSDLLRLLLGMGYELGEYEFDIRFTEGIDRLHVFTQRKSGSVVMVAESVDRSIFPPIFASDVTSKMNYMTSKGLFCPYPQLARRQLGLSLYHTPSLATRVGHRDQDIIILRKTSCSYFRPDCGSNCPLLWRRIRGHRGIAVFDWRNTDVLRMDWSSEIGGGGRTAYKWRLGTRCINPACDHCESA